jgi:WD40 repeat protein
MPRQTQPPRLHRRWQASIDDHVIALAWSPTGKALAAGAVGGPVTLFDAAGNVIVTLAGHGFGTTDLSWSKDGRLLSTCGQDGTARVWDATTGAERLALDAGASWVEHVAWGAASKLIATTAGRKVRLWDADGQLVRAYPDWSHTVACVRWRPKSRDLAVGGYGGVSVHDPDSDATKARFEFKGSVLTVEWSPDGKVIAAGNQDATVSYWLPRSGEPLQMAGYPVKVREIAWSWDGQWLATGGGEAVTVWDCSGKGPEGRKPVTLEAHESPVSALAYQPGGSVLASAGSDGRVVLWQPDTVKRAVSEERIEGGVTQIAWSQVAGSLAVGGESGYVAVYGL